MIKEKIYFITFNVKFSSIFKQLKQRKQTVLTQNNCINKKKHLSLHSKYQQVTKKKKARDLKQIVNFQFIDFSPVEFKGSRGRLQTEERLFRSDPCT